MLYSSHLSVSTANDPFSKMFADTYETVNLSKKQM